MANAELESCVGILDLQRDCPYEAAQKCSINTEMNEGKYRCMTFHSQSLPRPLNAIDPILTHVEIENCLARVPIVSQVSAQKHLKTFSVFLRSEHQVDKHKHRTKKNQTQRSLRYMFAYSFKE